MPGNPLPKIEINASRWPYDENGPANGKWGEVEVTAAPVSVLDASNPESTLKGTYGYIRYTNDFAASNIPNEEIPNSGGQRGFNYTVQGGQWPEKYAPGIDVDYEYLIPTDHVFTYMKIRQPDNLRVRRTANFAVLDISEVGAWEVGDSISTGEGVSGTICYIGTNKDGDPSVYIDDYLGGSPELRLDADTIITNDTKGASVTSAGMNLVGTNAKFISDWVGIGNGEYPNGGMHLGFQSSSISGSDLSGDGLVKFSGSQVDASGTGSHGDQSNQLGPQAALFDLDDNGEIFEIVVEKKRATAEGANDGLYRMWKKVNKAGHPLENWTLAFEHVDVTNCWSPYSNNEFQKGYLWGNKNGAYEEDTTFYTMRVEFWYQKPTFLTEAGV